jgi:hypothetical protein
MSRLCPFVIVADTTTVEALLQDHPFVFCAILVTTTAYEIPEQNAFDAVFREMLAKAVIIEGKRSLDYLQGLLIYLSWHQTSFRHENAQVFQLLHMAIGKTGRCVSRNLTNPDVRYASRARPHFMGW